jgi:hypothetical protein
MNLLTRLKNNRELANKARESKRLIQHFSDLAMSARKDYREGNFSGHPDEQLELIDGYLDMVRLLNIAQKRNWKVDDNKTIATRESLEWWKTHTIYNVGTDRYNEGVINHQNMVKWAEAGLI